MDLQNILNLIEQEKPEEAKKQFLEITPTESIEYWMVKGKLEQKFQKWSEAINAYLKVLDLDEQNEEAQNNLYLIQSIINFWNPEMFNP